MIITRTPYRLSLLGGGTDFPAWYLRNGGAVLAGAIDKYCYLTLRSLPPFFDHKFRIVYSRVENTNSPADIEHPTVRAALQCFKIESCVELHHDGDLPARSGIGSSAAFSVGIVHALRTLQSLPVDSWTLAQDAVYLEQEVMREIGGTQDQITCAIGGVNQVSFETSGAIRAESSQVLSAGAHAFSEWLVLLYTGSPRSSSDVSEGLLKHVEADRSGPLERMRDMVFEGTKLLSSGQDSDFEQIGILLDESWRLKRLLNPRAVTDRLEHIYERALAAGAIGGKISGAGAGGFMLFCVPPNRRDGFIQAMTDDSIHVPFCFVEEGSQVIFQS